MITPPDISPGVGASTLTVLLPLAAGASGAGQVVGVSSRTWRCLPHIRAEDQYLFDPDSVEQVLVERAQRRPKGADDE